MNSILQTQAERINQVLAGEPYRLHNYAQVVDMAAWMVNIPEHRASHLNDLTPAEQVRVLEQLANTRDGHALKEQWIAERTRDMQTLTAAQVTAQGEEWLR